jgi:serine/threonine-protein kinase
MTRAMTAPIGPGAMLAGKYRVERVLGEGGMGIVVAARHAQLDQRVAVKFMRAEALGQGDGVDRFIREAQAAAKLSGDHVVRVFDVGTLDNGSPYIVMEYLEGRDLASVLAERGRLPAGEAGGYVLEACEAMAEAHAQRIVHRDLKPENLFLVRRPGRKPLIKVLDFGISKLLEMTDALSSTKTSVMMGSPAYMSPEQMQSPKYVDGRTDIWSLGVILYQLTSGQLPYSAESVLMLSALVLTTEPPRLETVAPDVPPAFAAVVHRCLTRDLSRRFQTVDELADALAASLHGLATPLPMRLTAPEPAHPSGQMPRLTTPVPGSGGDATVPASALVGTPVPGSMTPLPAAAPASTIAGKKKKWVVPALAGAAVIAGVITFAVIKGGKQDDDARKVDEPAATTTQPTVQPIPAPTTPEPVVQPPPPAPAPAPPRPEPEPAAEPAPAPEVTPPPSKPEATTTRKKKPPKKKRPKERPDDDPFGTLQ